MSVFAHFAKAILKFIFYKGYILVLYCYRRLIFAWSSLTYSFHPSKIKKILWQKDLNSETCCLFHMYCKVLPLNTLQYIKTLSENNIDVMMTNSEELDEVSLAELKKHVKIYINITNTGFDFAGFKIAFELFNKSYNPQIVKKLILCNDSVLVEPSRFDQFLKRLLLLKDDYIGVGWGERPFFHACSWFFCVSNQVFQGKFFKKFWEQYKPYHSHEWAVQKGELELSQLLLQHQYCPKLMYDYSEVINSIKEFDPQDIFLFHKDAVRRLSQKIHSVDIYKKILYKIYSLHWRNGALHLFTKTDFPFIKKDIFYRRVYDEEQLRCFFLQKSIQNLDLKNFHEDLIKKGRCKMRFFINPLANQFYLTND